MTITIHQPHDKFFKANLKYQSVAIDFLKTYLEQEIFNKIDINSLQLAEKSFIIPELKEIHSDIIYKCLINNSPGYLFLLMEHQSTADPLMAFRLRYMMDALSQEHLKQGHQKIPIILSFCIYHGEKSPYPYSTCLFDCYDDAKFAKKVALKPFKLIDLTVLSDEEIKTHGLVGLMEMLFKHQRDKNFLSILRKMLSNQFIQRIIKQLDIPYLNDMLNYIANTGQDETEPKAAQHFIQELIKAFPEEPARKTIMTFAEQLKEDYKQEFMSTFAEQLKEDYKQEFMSTLAQQLKQEGLQQGEYNKAIAIAKNMLAKRLNPALIKEITGLSDQDLLVLEE